MISDFLFVFAGLIGLWFGSDITVNSAKKIAEHLKMSVLFVGLIITSIGTSLPEIITNIIAGVNNLRGIESSGIGVGNIIGSNISNIALILGIIAFFAVLHTTKKSLYRDGGVMIGASVLAYIMAANGFISRFEGGILIIVYIFYLAYLMKHEKLVDMKPGPGKKENPFVDYGLILVGMLMVVYGAYLVVNRGVIVAQGFGMPNYIIGLFVGLGTSLPELSVSIRAISKKYHHLSLGTLIGSNITNSLLALGAGAIVSGFSVSKMVLLFDFPFMLIVSIIVFLMLLNHKNLNKREAIVLILLYLLFMYLNLVVLN